MGKVRERQSRFVVMDEMGVGLVEDRGALHRLRF
jgi:hypothetical protein